MSTKQLAELAEATFYLILVGYLTWALIPDTSKAAALAWWRHGIKRVDEQNRLMFDLYCDLAALDHLTGSLADVLEIPGD